MALPCYNEEENIENILDHLRVVKKNLDDKREINFEILIINDGSTDKTSKILEENNKDFLFTIINFNENKGYGYTLVTGFKYAKEMGFTWVLSFDMDGQHAPKCIYKFMDKILENSSEDIISGSRYKSPVLFWHNPWKDRFLVNAIITGIFNTIGFSITDAFCGLKLHNVKKINTLDLELNGYEMPLEMLLKAKQKDFIISEMGVPVIYKNRDQILINRGNNGFLFRRGEERIEKYINVINNLLETPLRPDISDYVEIFNKFYNSVEEITEDNFEAIRNSIFTLIEEL